MNAVNRIIVNFRKNFKSILGKCDKRRKKFIPRMVMGIIKQKTTILAEIGRGIKRSDQSIKAIENSMSRQLSSDSWNEEELETAHLKEECKKIKKDGLVIIDPSERVKPYGKKMEHLDYVRDGSKDIVVPGYWTFEAISVYGQEIRYLMSKLFSLLDQNTPSFPGTIQRYISLIIDFSMGRGIHVLDRGFDSNDYIELYFRKSARFIMRLVGNRTVLNAVGDTIGVIEDAFKDVQLPYAIELLQRKRSGRDKEKRRLWFGYLKVRFPKVDGIYTLIIVKGDGNPMYLLTNVAVNKFTDAEKVIRGYLQRWNVEDVIRLVKQETKIEAFMVRKYVAIKRINFLAFVACAFLLTQSELGIIIMKKLEFAGACFKKKRDFIYYKIFMGIKGLFALISNEQMLKQLADSAYVY